MTEELTGMQLTARGVIQNELRRWKEATENSDFASEEAVELSLAAAIAVALFPVKEGSADV